MCRLSAAYEDSIGQAYAYDPANQVTHSRVNIANPAGANAPTSPTHAYTYDKAGNRTSSLAFGQSTTYSANNVNAYTSVSGGGFQPPSPTFDNKGNCPRSPRALRLAESSSGFWLFAPLLTQIGQSLTQPRANGTTQTLTWDGHDRLRNATSLTTPSATAQMFYDPLGRLTWVRRPDGANPPIDEIWSWSSWTLLSREVRQGSTPLDTFRYTWGPDISGTLEGAGGVGGLLAVEHAPGTSTTWDIRHHHYDANGNVLALTNATGQVSARYRYSPFGELISSSDLDYSGWNTRNIHRFSTKPEVASTGLLYYGYRWYDAQTGRWPSRDPIGERGGVNLYGFVANDGVGKWDFLGLLEGMPDNALPPDFVGPPNLPESPKSPGGGGYPSPWRCVVKATAKCSSQFEGGCKKSVEAEGEKNHESLVQARLGALSIAKDKLQAKCRSLGSEKCPCFIESSDLGDPDCNPEDRI